MLCHAVILRRIWEASDAANHSHRFFLRVRRHNCGRDDHTRHLLGRNYTATRSNLCKVFLHSRAPWWKDLASPLSERTDPLACEPRRGRSFVAPLRVSRANQFVPTALIAIAPERHESLGRRLRRRSAKRMRHARATPLPCAHARGAKSRTAKRRQKAKSRRVTRVPKGNYRGVILEPSSWSKGRLEQGGRTSKCVSG
jgi:hypothetical protein